MVKMKQKVSGYFRTQIYTHVYCPISSYLQTMANKGYNPLTPNSGDSDREKLYKGKADTLDLLYSSH